MRAKIYIGMFLFTYGGTYWLKKLVIYMLGRPNNNKGIFSTYNLTFFEVNIFPVIPSICLLLGLYMFYATRKRVPNQH